MKFLKKLTRFTFGFKKSRKTITPQHNIQPLSTISAHRIEYIFEDFSIYITKRYALTSAMLCATGTASARPSATSVAISISNTTSENTPTATTTAPATSSSQTS